jgi:hypothetical protein
MVGASEASLGGAKCMCLACTLCAVCTVQQLVNVFQSYLLYVALNKVRVVFFPALIITEFSKSVK